MLLARWQEMNAGQPLPKQYQEFVSYYQQLHDTWTSKLEDIQVSVCCKEACGGVWSESVYVHTQRMHRVVCVCFAHANVCLRVCVCVCV